MYLRHNRLAARIKAMLKLLNFGYHGHLHGEISRFFGKKHDENILCQFNRNDIDGAKKCKFNLLFVRQNS